MIKEILKKLLIAAITGAFILGFVYVKDHYLNEGDSDSELLNEVTFSNEIKELEQENTPQNIIKTSLQTKTIVEKPVEKDEQKENEVGELIIEIENTEEASEIINTLQANKKQIENKPVKDIQEQSFDEFKAAMKMNSNTQSAFDELENELNK